jgi:NDP-sugar pyrophosphorylase family protein
MKALILAAGLGTRLQPFTHTIPKPLFPVAGKPLLEIAIDNLIAAGCEALVINTHHLHERIEDFIAQLSYRIEIRTRYEPAILGTGGAIQNVADFWDHRPFMVVNADVFSTIDMQQLYARHCAHSHPVTLALYDEPDINTVTVDSDGFITDFNDADESALPSGSTKLTFTGIQVLDPEVLDYIPAATFSSSIDAFKKLTAAGKKIKAYIPETVYWNDIGTPERYQHTNLHILFPKAYQRAFSRAPSAPPREIRLKGDGSQRSWHRLGADGRSLIVADHGIQTGADTAEIDAFVNIGRHLYRCGIPVPRIYHDDRFSGLVFLEDLGDLDLQAAVQQEPDQQVIITWYQAVIDILIELNINAAANWNPAWAYQSRAYDKSLILEKECRYFIEAFANGYLHRGDSFGAHEAEFNGLADKALHNPVTGLMHRDLQSRNIMRKENQFYLIDFQGARPGPLQYDLASLLIDPYVELPDTIQSRLLDDCSQKVVQRTGVAADDFRHCYRYCCLTRNLQMLGAFGYLTNARQKTQFEGYIPVAVKRLASSLSGDLGAEFPGLKNLVQEINDDPRIREIKENKGEFT